jgi:hypothetical protein
VAEQVEKLRVAQLERSKPRRSGRLAGALRRGTKARRDERRDRVSVPDSPAIDLP